MTSYARRFYSHVLTQLHY